MTREQQIEFVAQAIRRVWGERSDKPKPREWKDLPEQVRTEFKREAKAAIEAYELSQAVGDKLAARTSST